MVKNPPTNAGDTGDVGSIPGTGGSPGGGNGSPLECSCLENPMDRAACGGAGSGMTERTGTDRHGDHLRGREMI